MASLWEIAIKQNIGRLSLPKNFLDKLYDESGFEILSIQPAHIDSYLALPLHHRDPFDRMLVAQAKHEGLTLITHDKKLYNYDIKILNETYA